MPNEDRRREKKIREGGGGGEDWEATEHKEIKDKSTIQIIIIRSSKIHFHRHRSNNGL